MSVPQITYNGMSSFRAIPGCSQRRMIIDNDMLILYHYFKYFEHYFKTSLAVAYLLFEPKI